MEHSDNLMVEQLLTVLNDWWTIVYPTDTIRGVGCDACNFDAVEKVYALKQRPKEKSMIVLCSSEEMLAEYGVMLTDTQRVFLAEAEKPTTLVLSWVAWLAENVYYSDGTVAVRIVTPTENNVAWQRCHGLLTSFGKPIVSTSANLSGQESPKYFSMIDTDILIGADMYVPPHIADTLGEPSQIVRFEEDGTISVLRK